MDSFPLSIALIIPYHKCIPLYSSEENKYLFKQQREMSPHDSSYRITVCHQMFPVLSKGSKVGGLDLESTGKSQELCKETLTHIKVDEH